jgi:DNA-binding Xre family transcriptional regulator
MHYPTAATATLRQLMAAVNVPSYRALARTAGVSDWAVTQLRRGQIGKMRLETVAALGAALSLPVYELLAAFGVGTETDSVKRLHLLEQEYGRLQAAVTQREAAARQACAADSPRPARTLATPVAHGGPCRG